MAIIHIVIYIIQIPACKVCSALDRSDKLGGKGH